MGDVISLKSKKVLGKQDGIKNDIEASGGIYLGCLPKLDAEEIRKVQTKLACQREQIDELVDTFEGDYLEYLMNTVVNTLIYFKADILDFNPELNDLMIGEDGHTWIGKRKEE